MDRTMKAYVVVGDGGDSMWLAFAENSATARREGGAELGLEFNEVDSCHRAPWADHLAEQGEIPAQVLYDNGYYSTCNGCGDVVDPTSGGILEGENAWCSSSCLDSTPDF